VSNLYITPHASLFGGSAAIAQLIKEYQAKYGSKPPGGASVTGYALGQTLVAALQKDHANPAGTTLAATLNTFHNYPSIEGTVTFTPTAHIQLGRALPIVRFTNGKPAYVTTVVPGVPVTLTLGGFLGG
jgi:ABC-type branched-subunit amino acid transport system substrate-binding protein